MAILMTAHCSQKYFSRQLNKTAHAPPVNVAIAVGLSVVAQNPHICKQSSASLEVTISAVDTEERRV